MVNKLAVAGSDSKYKLPDAEPAGFWAGFWHGAILPIAFLVSLFNPGVGIYEAHNNGAWYNFGFVLGAASSVGGRSVHVRTESGAGEDTDEPASDERASDEGASGEAAEGAEGEE